MSKKLVTVATFGTPTEANLARNQLDAEGIRAFLADETTVGMAWHLGNAVGGIKLQVADDDAERALSILESNEKVPISEDDWQSDDIADTPDFDHNDEDEETESPSDERVARAFRAAVLGLLLCPLQFYSLWLLLIVFCDKTPLNANRRRQAVTTLILDLPIIFLSLVFIWNLFSE